MFTTGRRRDDDSDHQKRVVEANEKARRRFAEWPVVLYQDEADVILAALSGKAPSGAEKKKLTTVVKRMEGKKK